MFTMWKTSAPKPDPFDVAADEAIARDMAILELPAPTIVNRAAGAISKFILECDEAESALKKAIELEQNTHRSRMADLTEQLRQTKLVKQALAPTVSALEDTYDPADDARKSYDAAVEAKRKRGDKHWPKRGEKPALVVAAE